MKPTLTEKEKWVEKEFQKEFFGEEFDANENIDDENFEDLEDWQKREIKEKYRLNHI